MTGGVASDQRPFFFAEQHGLSHPGMLLSPEHIHSTTMPDLVLNGVYIGDGFVFLLPDLLAASSTREQAREQAGGVVSALQGTDAAGPGTIGGSGAGSGNKQVGSGGGGTSGSSTGWSAGGLVGAGASTGAVSGGSEGRSGKERNKEKNPPSPPTRKRPLPRGSQPASLPGGSKGARVTFQEAQSRQHQFSYSG